MSNLEFVKLNTICTRITDGSHYSPKGISKGYPMLSVKDMLHHGFSYDDCKYISEEDYNDMLRNDCVPLLNDLLIAKDGSYLKHVFVIKEVKKQAILSSIGILRPDLKKINPEYLKYYLHSNSVKVTVAKKYVSGSALPRIILKNFGEIDIIYKPLDEQQKIAKVLSDLDAKIELNNKINTELEAMTKTLYDYWFVQFDFPDANGKPYKTSGGKMFWNEELKREIPEGWKADLLGSWIGKDKSGDWGKEVIEGNYTEKVHCIRGADLNGLNGNGEVKAPTRYILEKNSHKMLDTHDLIVEISGGSPTQSTGRMAYITKETLSRFDAPIICSNFCKAVTLKDEIYLYNFAFEWNKAYDNGILFGYEGKTSGIKNLLFESFVSSYYTTKPPENLAEKFYDFMEPIQSKKQKNLLENQQLASLRDWLLPMLMNGQVSVGEVEGTSHGRLEKLAELVEIFGGQYKENNELGMVADEIEKYKKSKA
jgi:type I restriction enzyme S subunit